MRTYIRGDRASFASTLTKSDKLKYFLIDEKGDPIGKPFRRRSEIELYEATIDGDYQIISGRVGRPSCNESDQEIKRRHDRKRQSDVARRAKKAEYARDRRARQKANQPPETRSQPLPASDCQPN